MYDFSFPVPLCKHRRIIILILHLVSFNIDWTLIVSKLTPISVILYPWNTKRRLAAYLIYWRSFCKQCSHLEECIRVKAGWELKLSMVWEDTFNKYLVSIPVTNLVLEEVISVLLFSLIHIWKDKFQQHLPCKLSMSPHSNFPLLSHVTLRFQTPIKTAEHSKDTSTVTHCCPVPAQMQFELCEWTPIGQIWHNRSCIDVW